MKAKALKEALELFKDNTTLTFEKWPIRCSNILNELATLNIVEIKFYQGNIIVKLKEKDILELAVKDEANSIILFDNSSDRNNYKVDKYDKHYVYRQLYVLKKKNKYKALLRDNYGNAEYATDFYVDNICIICYQWHPCYVKDTVFGLKFLVGKKFCFLRTESKELTSDLSMLTQLTPLSYKQWNIYFGNVSTSSTGHYYQTFAGWEETWLLPPERHWINDKVFYEQVLSSNSDAFSYYNAKPCAEYEFFVKVPWGVERIGYAYDDKKAENNLEKPFFYNEEYNKIYKEYLNKQKKKSI